MISPSKRLSEAEQMAAGCRSLRAMLDVTQPEFAKKMGISVTTLVQLEAATLGAQTKYRHAMLAAAGVSRHDYGRLLGIIKRLRE